MLHSLRLRLLLTMVAVVAVTAGTVALLSQQTTISEFQRFIQLSDERSQRLGAIFTEASQLRERSPAERQAAVERMEAELGDRVILADEGGTVIADSAGALVGRPVTEAPGGDVLLIRLTAAIAGLPSPQVAVGLGTPGQAVSEPLPPGAAPMAIIQIEEAPGGMQPTAAPPTDQIYYSAGPGVEEGSFQVSSVPVMVSWEGLAGPDPIREGFVSGVNRSLGMALVAAGLAALLLTAALSRRIIRPVEELTAAARQMGAGDLSRRVAVRSNDEIAALGRAFNRMAEELEQAERLRRNMVSDVAHELRTPLTNIRGYLEALRDGVVRPDARVIDSLHEEALLLNRLIDDLQDLALAEAGQLRLERQPADLAAVVDQAVSVVRPRLKAKGVACSVELPAGLPPALIDAERVGQVLRNLLNNALTHTPAGGSITVAAEVEDVGGLLAVTVADTGCGIAAEDLPLIFERFYRADRSRARATGGAGLGLTIVRQLVEAHGGTVGVESRPGAGARFRFTLPARA